MFSRRKIAVFGNPGGQPYESIIKGLRSADLDPLGQVAHCFTVSQPIRGIAGVVVAGEDNGREWDIADFYKARNVPSFVLGKSPLDESRYSFGEILPGVASPKSPVLSADNDTPGAMSSEVDPSICIFGGNEQNLADRDWAVSAVRQIRSICEHAIYYVPGNGDWLPDGAIMPPGKDGDNHNPDLRTVGAVWFRDLTSRHHNNVRMAISALKSGCVLLADVPGEFAGLSTSLAKFSSWSPPRASDVGELLGRFEESCFTLEEIGDGLPFAEFLDFQGEEEAAPSSAAAQARIAAAGQGDPRPALAGDDGASAQVEPVQDDLTTIAGVGTTTVEKLGEIGVRSFEDLANASREDLEGLNLGNRALGSIRAWRGDSEA